MAVDFRTLPDLEGAVLERLVLCYQAMSPEIKRAIEQPPLTPVNSSEMPFATTMIGGLLEPIVTGNEVMTINRRFYIYVYIFPFEGGIDDLDEGAESMRKSKGLPALLRNYFSVHGYLSTPTLPPLLYVQDTQYLCEGIGQRQAAGGQFYLSLRASLDVYCQIKVG